MDSYYKLRLIFYYKVRHGLLKIATGITKCDGFITNCDSTHVYVRKICVRILYKGSAWKIARKRESWTSLNFSFKLGTFYLASILWRD